MQIVKIVNADTLLAVVFSSNERNYCYFLMTASVVTLQFFCTAV